MATVLHRTTKELRRSVNTPDYDPADWIIGPDLTAVAGWPPKYWIVSGDAVSLMDRAGRDAADAAEAEAAVEADRMSQKARLDGERLLKAFALVVMDEINVLRGLASLPARSEAQLVAAIKIKVDSV